MFKNTLILFFFLALGALKLIGQTDAYSGTWFMEYQRNGGANPIKLELQIAASEKNLLYPAHLKLTCGSFIGDYELLLVKKNSRELGISRNKFPLSESLFGLGYWPVLLNGSFDLSKDLKGIPTLTAMRIQSKEVNLSLPDTLNMDPSLKGTAV